MGKNYAKQIFKLVEMNEEKFKIPASKCSPTVCFLTTKPIIINNHFLQWLRKLELITPKILFSLFCVHSNNSLIKKIVTFTIQYLYSTCIVLIPAGIDPHT